MPSSRRGNRAVKPKRKRLPFKRPSRNFLREWWEAAGREERAREAVFSGAPYLIEGIEIRLMTLRDLLELRRDGNPLVMGGTINFNDALSFLWQLLPTRDEAAFSEAIDAVENPREIFAGIFEFIDLMFMDKPSGGSGQSAAYCSFAASLIDHAASEYGWKRDEVLDTPLPHLFQIQRSAWRRKGATLPNRWRDRAAAAFLEEINKVPVKHRDAWVEYQANEMKEVA